MGFLMSIGDDESAVLYIDKHEGVDKEFVATFKNEDIKHLDD